MRVRPNTPVGRGLKHSETSFNFSSPGQEYITLNRSHVFGLRASRNPQNPLEKRRGGAFSTTPNSPPPRARRAAAAAGRVVHGRAAWAAPPSRGRTAIVGGRPGSSRRGRLGSATVAAADGSHWLLYPLCYTPWAIVGGRPGSSRRGRLGSATVAAADGSHWLLYPLCYTP